MLVEARTLEQGRQIEADVCVIGCGPAGLTLIKELAAQSLRVCALESGARRVDQDAQALCEGTIISPDRYPRELLMTSRQRQLGGTANLWDDELDAGSGEELVRFVPLDKIDFEKRAWVPYSGWPFDKSHLDPFYDRALQLGGAGRLAPDILSWNSDHAELLSPGAQLRTIMSQFGARTVFTRDYPEELAREENVHVYLSATLLELVLEGNAIRRARVAVSTEHEFEISAKIFVLAAGGIENARLLLLSNRTQPNGLGNQHDLVGRFFMDHPTFRLGVFTPADRRLFRSAGLYDHHIVNGVRVMGKLTISEEVMRREKMLNIGAALAPRSCGYESDATKALKRVFKSGSTTVAARLLRKEFRTLIAGWNEILVRSYERLTKRQSRYFQNKGGWSRLRNIERRFRRFEMSCLSEQAPNPENRVTLSDHLDRFGQRKVELHWRWSDLDLRSIRRAQDILKEEIEQHELGKFETQVELDGGPPRFLSPHHHMGTTRMHSNPKEGVVDANCQVHGISNLYVTGSSVFPTGGFANPTLTIMALAVRLSYHLKELMKSPFSSVSGSGATRPASTHRGSD